MSELIYLDHAASTPVDPAVVDVVRRCLAECHANPSSAHAYGAQARRVIEEARASIAARIGGRIEGVVFTSGATEANNLALKGVLAASDGRRHLVTTRIEHASVLESARALEAQGVVVTWLACDAAGRVAAQQVEEALRADTALVSVMHVNNEIGVVQDIAAIAAVCAARGVPLHVDAAQSIGKVPFDADGWGVDLVSLTAHKAHGPKGIGALYVGPRARLEPLLHGGEQERGLRAGTLPTHQIAGFGKTYELADPQRDGPRLAALRDGLWERLRALDGVRRNGHAAHVAPHILNVSFAGVEGESLRLALTGVAASAGSACASDSPEVSHVLSSLGLSDALASSSLRFSVGRTTQREEIDLAAERVAAAVTRLKVLAGRAPEWCSSAADLR